MNGLQRISKRLSLLMAIAGVAFVGCSTDEVETGGGFGGDTVVGYYYADFMEDGEFSQDSGVLPTEDEWIINDLSLATIRQGESQLAAAIQRAGEAGRSVKVLLPKMSGVANYLFEDADALVGVEAPRATFVGDSAFAGCDALESVDMPLVIRVGSNAFDGASLAEGVSFEELAVVGDFAFANTSMSAVSFPRVRSIGSEAFANTALTELTLDMTGDIVVVGSTFDSFDSNSCVLSVNDDKCDGGAVVPQSNGRAWGGAEWSSVNGVTTDPNYVYNYAASDFNDDGTVTEGELRIFSPCKLTISGDIENRNVAEALDRLAKGSVDMVLSNAAIICDSAFDGVESINSIEANAATSLGASFVSGVPLTSLSLSFKGAVAIDGAFDGFENSAECALTLGANLGATAVDNVWNGMTWGSIEVMPANYFLSEFDSSTGALFDGSYPVSDVWYISDSGEITVSAMAGLKAAIAANSDVKLEFTGATALEASLFDSSTNLAEVKLAKVTTLGSSIFAGCDALVVDLSSASVTSGLIEKNAFDGFDNSVNSTITLGETENYFVGNEWAGVKWGTIIGGVETIRSYVLDDFNAGGEFAAAGYPTDDIWIISDEVALSIDNLAGLKSVIDRANKATGNKINVEFSKATSVSASTFQAWATMGDIYLPEVTTIANYAFKKAKITSIYVPKVESVGNDVFSQMYAIGLREIDFPSATSMGTICFLESSITTLKFGASSVDLKTDADVASGTASFFTSANGAKSFKTSACTLYLSPELMLEVTNGNEWRGEIWAEIKAYEYPAN